MTYTNMETAKKRSIEPLRERVYAYLKDRINTHQIRAGEFLDLDGIGAELGMSRTPLRDALFQLESEGFITIFPRRGVMVNTLELKTIRDIYEIIGALESAALISVSVRIDDRDVSYMNELNDVMEAALSKDDYATYYERNVAFHDVFLDKSDNAELVRHARIQRERLYDFPRTLGFLKEWDESNLSEHREMVRMLVARNFNAAADFLRDVHWSFSVQERYIRKYYLALKQE